MSRWPISLLENGGWIPGSYVRNYPWTPKPMKLMKVSNAQFMGYKLYNLPKNEGCPWVPMLPEGGKPHLLLGVFKVSLRPLVQGMIADLGDDAAAQV